MRVVLDTNIFISGIFWQGNFCSQIISAWRKGKITLISSIPIINELAKTLRDFKIQMPEEMIETWKNIIIKNSIMVSPITELNIIKEDPSDNKFLESAIEGKADYIITQDNHLLKLGELKNIKIITPKEFLGE